MNVSKAGLRLFLVVTSVAWGAPGCREDRPGSGAATPPGEDRASVADLSRDASTTISQPAELAVMPGQVSRPAPQKAQAVDADAPQSTDATPQRPILPDEAAARVEELEKQIQELREQGQYERAVPLAREALEIRLEHQGPTSTVGSKWTNTRGELAEWWEVADARRLVQELRRRAEMPNAQQDELAQADRAGREYESLYSSGEYEEAERTIRRNMETYRGLLGEGHPNYVTGLNNRACLLNALGRTEEAESLLVQVLESRQRMFQGDHPMVSDSLNNLAMVRKALGRSAEAEPLVVQALEMNERLYGGDYAAVADSLNNLALVRHDLGRLTEAEPLCRRALEMYQRLYEGDHPAIANCMDSLGLLLDALGRSTEAEFQIKQALEMNQRLYNGDHPAIADSLNNLGYVYQSLGQLEMAERLSLKTLEMNQRLFPGDHPHVAAALNNLATVRETMGQLAEAEKLYVQALDMNVRRYPGDHPWVASALNNLAGVREALGRSAEAEPLYRRALEMNLRLYKGDSPDVANSLNNLAFALQGLGRSNEAEPLYLQASEMFQRLYSGDHSDVATSLNNLALLHEALGRYEEAEPLFTQALDMLQRLYTEDHPMVAGSLNNLALVREALGRAAEAEPLYVQAMEMHQRLYPRDHPYVARSLYNLARVRHELRKTEDAESLYCQSFEMCERLRTLATGGAAERAAYAQRLSLTRIAIGLAQGLIELHRDSEALAILERGRARAALDLLEQSGRNQVAEARVLDEPKRTKRLKSAKAKEDQDHAALVSAEFLLASTSWQRSATASREDLDIDAKRKLLAGFDEQIAKLAEDVKDKRENYTQSGAAVRVELQGLFPAGKPLTLDEILQGLSPDEAVISFGWGEDSVLVAVAGNGASTAELIAKDKEAVARLIEWVRRYRASIAQKPGAGPEFDLSAARELLAALLPDSIRQQLSNVRRLLVLPDGPLNDVPLEALLIGEAKDSLIAGKAVVYAPSATVYMDRKRRSREFEDRKSGEQTTAVVLGDPVFPQPRSDPGEMLRSQQVMDQITRGGGEEFAANVSATEQVRLFGGPLDPLPGSGREARAIARLFRASKGLATLLTGPAASVPKLWEAVTKSPPRYLHLATHGLTGSADRPQKASLALTQPENPTLEDVGFLRLEDLLGGWGGRLDGCELVVLSACDTQRGVRKGDTAMSLPLGFFYAGAETVVASLWKVDDNATSLLMSRMYENLLGVYDQPRTIRGRTYQAKQPMTKLDALDEAKAWLRSLTEPQRQEALARLDETAAPALAGASDKARGLGDPQPAKSLSPESTHPYDHPYYWAGFILVGDAE